MSKKFQYNFTNENQLVELREKVYELQQQNNLLKQSLEQLIKVNTQLTESIQEFNHQNNQAEYQSQQISEMAQTIEALNNEIESLKRQIQNLNYQKSKTSKKVSDAAQEHQTESLVSVLQELIDSFKNMQTRYEGEMSEFNKTFEEYKNSYQYSLKKLEEQYQQKLNTIEPVMMQLHRKDQNLNFIQQKISNLESAYHALKSSKPQPNHIVKDNSSQIKKMYEGKLAQKDKVISFYQSLIQKLKVKFNQRL